MDMILLVADVEDLKADADGDSGKLSWHLNGGRRRDPRKPASRGA